MEGRPAEPAPHTRRPAGGPLMVLEGSGVDLTLARVGDQRQTGRLERRVDPNLPGGADPKGATRREAGCRWQVLLSQKGSAGPRTRVPFSA